MIPPRFLSGLVALFWALGSPQASRAQMLEILPPPAPGLPPRFQSAAGDASLLRLETSVDLSGWTETGRFHDALFPYADLGLPSSPHRFHRLLRGPRTPDDDWKNQVLFPSETFLAPGQQESVRWVKFALRPTAPWRVYFQNSTLHPFHYDFATRRLDPFIGLSRPDFDALTLHRAGQQLVLGTLLFPPRANLREYAVQFTGLDPYTPDEVAAWFTAVKNAVHTGGPVTALYMPVFEQAEATRRDAALLEARGVVPAAIDRWVSDNHVYSPGWAIGRLKYIPGTELEAAFTDGRLLSTDILLTDGVPAETPPVAGILSLTPSTPNSHTAILAQSFGIPFAHLPDNADQQRLRALDGHKIILRAIHRFGAGLVKVIDTDATFPPEVEAGLLALKAPQPIQYSPKQTRGVLSVETSTLLPADIASFGGKSVNYALLRRTIPANTPAAVSFSFDLWDRLMDTVPAGNTLTLRAEIAARLAPYRTWPPQVAALKNTLDGIRSLIRSQTSFDAATRQEILTCLAGFDPARKIRFRSSTNVEDGDTFTGAGLYDSYSGCLLDDLDNNSTGPCQCDPGEPAERGVFRAIQRVYASFYNDNAYLERLRHHVVEAETAMGILCHHSFPDEEEMANGVATLDFRYTFSETMDGTLVTQLGADPVANPTGASSPEIVDASRYGPTNYLTFRRTSSRVPLGGYVMGWESDYRTFMDLFKTTGNAWRQFHPARDSFRLDFEYKKDLTRGLIVKQVREIPLLTAGSSTAWLIDEPTILVTAQQESGSVFGNHRLKSLWNLRTANGLLTPAFLTNGLFQSGTLTHLGGGTPQVLTGALSSWPSASLSPSGTTHRWTTGSGPAMREWQLDATVTTTVSGTTPPLFTASDFPITLAVTYATPMPATLASGAFTTTTSDLAVLAPPLPVTPGSIPVTRVLDNGKGVVVRTRFLWPDEPPTAGGYTAPLVRFEETTLTGLTSQPIVLTNYFAQTYRPGHHNFTEDFIFEPALDPSVPPGLLTELTSTGIQYLHIRAGTVVPVMNAVSPTGEMRKL